MARADLAGPRVLSSIWRNERPSKAPDLNDVFGMRDDRTSRDQRLSLGHPHAGISITPARPNLASLS